MLNDPKVIKLFELLLEKNPGVAEPVFAPRRDGWLSYPLVESALGVDAEYAIQLLEDLRRLGYLERRFRDKLYLCPACNSQDLKLVGVCPRCSSRHVVRESFVEHMNCGHTAPAVEFYRSGVRTCPKCRVELVLVGSDYLLHTGRYRCEYCGDSFDRPLEQWFCRVCQRSCGQWEVRELVMYDYLLNEQELARLRSERIPKAKVKDFFLREGYEVKEGVQVTGRSGAEHRIDLLASKRVGPSQHRVVVGFACAQQAVDSEEVIKLYAKAYDVNAQDIIMVVAPKLSEDAEQFAQHYHIRVYGHDQLDRLAVAQVAG